MNNTYERALVTMHKMPRIWINYCEFLMAQPLVTRTRRAFDRALAALPITQHDRLWQLYLKFINQPGACRALCLGDRLHWAELLCLQLVPR